MTYKLNPSVSIIISPVVLIFPNGVRKEYENGMAVAEDQFEHKYLIKTITATNETAELKLVEQEAPKMYWSGEEAISFF